MVFLPVALIFAESEDELDDSVNGRVFDVKKLAAGGELFFFQM